MSATVTGTGYAVRGQLPKAFLTIPIPEEQTVELFAGEVTLTHASPRAHFSPLLVCNHSFEIAQLRLFEKRKC
jgi:hypothetical protein